MSTINPLFRQLNSTKDMPEKRTYIVVGLGRSGTSFIASVLSWLGVFLGDDVTDFTLEDARLGNSIEDAHSENFTNKRDVENLKAVIADYNSRYPVWGYKRPSMLLAAAKTETLFRNPCYIFTHRDFFTVALRNEIAIGRELTESIRKCADASDHIYRLMETTNAPSLHLSFELTSGDRLRAAAIIRDFVRPEDAGKPIDVAEFEAFMDERHKRYFGVKS